MKILANENFPMAAVRALRDAGHDVLWARTEMGGEGDEAVGPADADREVQVSVEPVAPAPLSPDEWRRRILETAGKWEGPLVRPEQGEYEKREPLR